MRFIFVLVFFLFCVPTVFALETDFSGNIEGQLRHSDNNQLASEPPLYQDWTQDDFYLLYGNLNGKIQMAQSRVEANWFGRYSQSDLYNPDPIGGTEREPYFATRVFTFPNRLVARDIFLLQHTKQVGDHQFESVLNKLYYERDFQEQRIMVGRLYVNYGLGEIFNPINPFNQPTGLTSISQVAQGNDGLSYTYFFNDNHHIQFLILGDKRIEGYDGSISKTLWAHGEYQYDDKMQLDYALGEDQNRYKWGGQLSYQFEEALAFTQLLYQSQNIKNDPSEDLWDAMVGYDQQISGKWHLRFEGGYQKQNSYVKNLNDLDRFLPTEYFAALANIYEIHPLVKLSATLINDIKSGFSYFIGKGTYSAGKNMELDHFIFMPLAKGNATDNLAQRLVTLDIGVSLRAFF